MQGFHAGVRRSGIGGRTEACGLYEFTQTHVVYMQRGGKQTIGLCRLLGWAFGPRNFMKN